MTHDELTIDPAAVLLAMPSTEVEATMPPARHNTAHRQHVLSSRCRPPPWCSDSRGRARLSFGRAPPKSCSVAQPPRRAAHGAGPNILTLGPSCSHRALALVMHARHPCRPAPGAPPRTCLPRCRPTKQHQNPTTHSPPPHLTCIPVVPHPHPRHRLALPSVTRGACRFWWRRAAWAS